MARALFEDLTDENGRVRFCDVPMGYFDLTVGHDVCGAVGVRHIKLTWPITNRIIVTYEPKPCDHLGIEASCLALIRVHDSGDRPVQGAQLFKDRVKVGEVSDVLGRIYLTLQSKAKFVGFVAKAASRADLQFECVNDVEVKVRLP